MGQRTFPSKKNVESIKVEVIDTTTQEVLRKLNANSPSDGWRDNNYAAHNGKLNGIPFQFRTLENDKYLPRRFVSAEIELTACKGRDVLNNKETWAKIAAVCSAVKSDGSVGGDGLELNTMPAKGLVYHKQMNILKEAFSAHKAKADRSCGLHIHVDCRDLNGRHMFKLMNVWARVEDEMLELIRPDRRGASYCRKVFNNESSKKEWLDKKFLLNSKENIQNNISRFSRSVNGADYYERYKTLNFAAYSAHRTVEFRLHHGTANATLIKNWGILCAHLVEFAKNATMSESRNCTLSTIVKDSAFLKKFVENKKEKTKNSEVEEIFSF